MDIVNPEVEAYMASLQTRHDEPVLLEMEAEGRERGFPIVGRNVGVTLEVLARSIGARRVIELGSGLRLQRVLVRARGRARTARCTAPTATRRTPRRREDYLDARGPVRTA